MLFLFFIQSHFFGSSKYPSPDLMGSFERLASEIRLLAAAEKDQVISPNQRSSAFLPISIAWENFPTVSLLYSTFWTN